MIRFIVFGRGRSGTTVVADELSRHPQIALPSDEFEMAGEPWKNIEPFMRFDPPGHEHDEVLRQRPEPVAYDLWRHLHDLADSLPSRAAYLDELESWGAGRSEVRAVGFKIIDSQMLEREGLFELLRQRDYRVVNLHRLNVVRHALSGLLARARGVFNARNYRDSRGPYPIDVEEFRRAIHDIQHWVQRWDAAIAGSGIASLDVAYEGFLADRDGFYREILEFLHLDPTTPPPSDYSRMVPGDLSEAVANYPEIEAACAQLGLEHMLSLP